MSNSNIAVAVSLARQLFFEAAKFLVPLASEASPSSGRTRPEKREGCTWEEQ